MAEHGPTLDQIRASLTGESPILAAQRKRFRHLPSDPRCKPMTVRGRSRPVEVVVERAGVAKP